MVGLQECVATACPSNQNREARLFVRKRETDERVKLRRSKPDMLKLGELSDKLEEGYVSMLNAFKVNRM